MHDDPKMGWSRWAHTIRVFTLNSGLFYIRPNERTLALMDRISERLMREKSWDQVRLPIASKNPTSGSCCACAVSEGETQRAWDRVCGADAAYAGTGAVVCMPARTDDAIRSSGLLMTCWCHCHT